MNKVRAELRRTSVADPRFGPTPERLFETTYALGHSDEELERLSRQAEVFEPFTRHLFQQAGITTACGFLMWGAAAET